MEREYSWQMNKGKFVQLVEWKHLAPRETVRIRSRHDPTYKYKVTTRIVSKHWISITGAKHLATSLEWSDSSRFGLENDLGRFASG